MSINNETNELIEKAEALYTKKLFDADIDDLIKILTTIKTKATDKNILENQVLTRLDEATAKVRYLSRAFQ